MSDRGARMIAAGIVTASGVTGVGLVCLATALPNGYNGGVVMFFAVTRADPHLLYATLS